MAIATGDIIRAAVRVTGPKGQDVVNVWYFEASFDTPMDDASFLTALGTQLKNIYSSLNTYQTNNYLPLDIKVDTVTWNGVKIVITRSLGYIAWPVGYSPGNTTSGVPVGAAILTSFRTAGIKTLCRKFISGIAATYLQDDGSWNATVVSAIASMMTAFLSDIVLSAGKNLKTVVHAKRLNQWVTFTAAIIRSEAAYQRRRRAGTGS